MSSKVRVSAWGIRHNLGPISLPLRDSAGTTQWHQVTEGSKEVSLGQLPAHLKDVFGADTFEIPDWYLVEATEEERSALRAALAVEGSVISTVTVDGRFVGDGNAENREDDHREIERVLDLVATFGVRSARVNLLPPPIVPSGSAASFDEIVQGLRQLTAYAKARGIKLLIENHCELTSTPQAVITLLDAVGPDLGLILDTGNIEPVQSEIVASFMEKRLPEDVPDVDPVYSFIKELAGRAALVHIKTYGFHADGSSKVYDIPTIMNVLTETGYIGPVTIECAEFDPPRVYQTIQKTVELVNDKLGAKL